MWLFNYGDLISMLLDYPVPMLSHRPVDVLVLVTKGVSNTMVNVIARNFNFHCLCWDGVY